MAHYMVALFVVFISVHVAKLLYSNGMQDIYLYSLLIVCFHIFCELKFGALQAALASACSLVLRRLVAAWLPYFEEELCSTFI